MAVPALPPLPPPLVEPLLSRAAPFTSWLVERVRWGRAAGQSLCLGLCVGLCLSSGVGCVGHEQVLEAQDSGHTGGTGGATGGAAVGGSIGTGGTPSMAGGGNVGGMGGMLDPGEGCSSDLHCGAGAWCTGGHCVPCGTTLCPVDWVKLPRNGCEWCVPPSDCVEDADCGEGVLCSAGQACLPECDPGDPACCHGNLCDVTGCGTTWGLDCVVVGCPDGQQCVSGGGADACACDPELGAWLCAEGAGTCE